ncbi:MAG TPA: hypothetical protein DCO83_14610 [Mucilaginibacter sp.]|jgi:hypothetical protein|nr:hypothetical protein [Mucilaginibacter sp.]
MIDEKEPQRDALGNIIFPAFDYDIKTNRWWELTYVFQHYSEELKTHIPYFGIERHDEESLSKARNAADFMEVNLHIMPESMYFRDFFIYHLNLQLSCLVKFFKEVFNDKSAVGGYGPANKYYRLILPKTLYFEIMVFINEHQLLLFKDLILEVIATAQQIYTEDIHYYDNEQFRKKIKNIKKEVSILETIISRTSRERFDRTEKQLPELSQINFIFQDGSRQIKDPILTSVFVDEFKDHLENLPLKDWHLELERYGRIYDEDEEKLNFKEDLSIALYNFLTQTGFYKLKGSPRPNDLMHMIEQIMSFALIPIGKPGEISQVKIKHIRNYLKRNQLKEKITSLKVDVNKEILYKYFDKDFIDLPVGENKKANILSIAGYLVVRFKMHEMANEIAHIVQCLNDSVWLMMDQLSSGLIGREYEFPQFLDYKLFVQKMRAGQRIDSASFKIEGVENELSITNRFPLYIIENALKEYIHNHKEEVENDIVKGKITRTLNENSYGFGYGKRFHLPEERFVVQFVKSFYNYLLHELPPPPKEYRPSEKYYTIIAVVLLQTHFFRGNPTEEANAVEQVKTWHIL